MNRARVPEGFLFGAATSAYQIEGAWNENDKGESIWDRFAHTPGAIEDATTGNVACDHVHRLDEDLGLIAALGLDAYRFSVSWPRVLPSGRGSISSAGLAFYDRLVDGLLARGIRPFLTLYHWDLPQALQDAGGWTVRETADAFSEFADVVTRQLGDRVKDWITLNEPFVSAIVGHWEGRHAPGHRSENETIAAIHHLLLAHGRSVPIIRANVSEASVGITNVHQPVYPASSSVFDRRAAQGFDALLNRAFLDPLVGRGYPKSLPFDRALLEARIRPGDLDVIAAPLDFLGVNYYTRRVVRDQQASEDANAPRTVFEGNERTEMDWEVYPEGLFEVFDRLHREYAFPRYYLTENGAAYPDRLVDGRVRDDDRVSYLDRHLWQVGRVVRAGIPLHGFFVWSLLDNFEWAHGYTKRFGLVYVDFESGKRIRKSSYCWYRSFIARRVFG